MLVQLYSDVVVTADSAVGLRAWMTKGTQRLLALSSFDSHGSGELIPTSLAVDTSNYAWTTLIISVGFADGRFGIYAMDKMKSCLERIYMHAPLVNSRVSAIAVALPYIITITEAQLLSVYSFSIKPEGPLVPQNSDPPQLLSCLKSYTIWPPLSLSIRIVSTNIIASIVYALPIFLSGWSVGLQEFRFTLDGNVLDSRLTCAASQGFEPLISRPSIASSPMEDRATPSFRSVEFSETPSLTKPTSLSYSHPYLLASHPDNTLTLYLVHSTERELVIGNGSRLWGHTSSISGAHVGDRGKAVSVSEHGSEIRIWDLEGGISSSFPRNRLPARETGVQLIPDIKPTGVTLHTTDHLSAEPLGMGIGLNLRPSFGTGNSAITKGWVGFDDEKVIVLREKSGGSQALVIYDFS